MREELCSTVHGGTNRVSEFVAHTREHPPLASRCLLALAGCVSQHTCGASPNCSHSRPSLVSHRCLCSFDSSLSTAVRVTSAARRAAGESVSPSDSPFLSAVRGPSCCVRLGRVFGALRAFCSFCCLVRRFDSLCVRVARVARSDVVSCCRRRRAGCCSVPPVCPPSSGTRRGHAIRSRSSALDAGHRHIADRCLASQRRRAGLLDDDHRNSGAQQHNGGGERHTRRRETTLTKQRAPTAVRAPSAIMRNHSFGVKQQVKAYHKMELGGF